jgi:ferredoxin--NADP+ reductase
MSDPTLNATVALRRDLNGRLAVVRVAPQGWELPAHEPGQFATLGLPDPDGPGKFLRRVYSIASAPGADQAEFYIQLVKEGPFTTRLWHLHEGDALHLSPKVGGTFTLAGVPEGADVLLLATGTGLAPYLSMLRAFRGSGRLGRCVVVQGARTADELGYRAELSHWAAEDRGVIYLPTLTREPDGPGWDGTRGRIQALLQSGELERRAGLALDPARCHVFLCGHPGLIDEVEALLAPRGYRQWKQDGGGSLHFERWW